MGDYVDNAVQNEGLDCPVCGEARAFTIDPNNPAAGYCVAEDEIHTIRPVIDFSCRVCGVTCAIAPDPPARAICPEHCEDHSFVYDRDRRGKYCEHCDEEMPFDWNN